MTGWIAWEAGTRLFQLQKAKRNYCNTIIFDLYVLLNKEIAP